MLFFQVNNAQVVLENEVKITDFGLHFNGNKVATSSSDNGNPNVYDFVFGRNRFIIDYYFNFYYLLSKHLSLPVS